MLEASGQHNFHARYPSAYHSVAHARHAVADFALDCGFDLCDACDIALAVGEACNNAAEHGHVERGQFHLGCSFDGVDLSIEVSDAGGGFDIESVGARARPPETERGLGIFLMRSLMDGVEYDCGSGTTVRLIKRRHLDL